MVKTKPFVFHTLRILEQIFVASFLDLNLRKVRVFLQAQKNLMGMQQNANLKNWVSNEANLAKANLFFQYFKCTNKNMF